MYIISTWGPKVNRTCFGLFGPPVSVKQMGSVTWGAVFTEGSFSLVGFVVHFVKPFWVRLTSLPHRLASQDSSCLLGFVPSSSSLSLPASKLSSLWFDTQTRVRQGQSLVEKGLAEASFSPHEVRCTLLGFIEPSCPSNGPLGASSNLVLPRWGSFNLQTPFWFDPHPALRSGLLARV